MKIFKRFLFLLFVLLVPFGSVFASRRSSTFTLVICNQTSADIPKDSMGRVTIKDDSKEEREHICSYEQANVLLGAIGQYAICHSLDGVPVHFNFNTGSKYGSRVYDIVSRKHESVRKFVGALADVFWDIRLSNYSGI